MDYYYKIIIFSEQDRESLHSASFQIPHLFESNSLFLDTNVEIIDKWPACESKDFRSPQSLQNTVLCQKISSLSTCHRKFLQDMWP